MKKYSLILIGVAMAQLVLAQEAGETKRAPVVLPLTDAFSPPERFPAEVLIPLDGYEEVQSERVGLLLEAARLYMEQKEFEAAYRALIKANREEPDNLGVFYAAATLYQLTENHARAIEILNGLVTFYPESSILHNNLAWSYAVGAGVRDGKKALFHAREALLISPYLFNVWNTLAEAYYICGQYDGALRSSEHAISLLQGTQASEELLQKARAQLQKIIRARDALKALDGEDLD